MSTISRPDLIDADPDEIGAHLRLKGIGIYTLRAVLGDTFYITADVEEPVLTLALADYVPVAPKGTWQPEPDPLDVEAETARLAIEPILAKCRDVYAGNSTFTAAQRDKLLAGLALLAYRRLR